MIKHALDNWQTTSAGLTVLITNCVHLAWAVTHGTDNENTWTFSMTAMVVGVGLILAGDARKSASKSEVDLVAEAVKTGDTSMLKKSDAPPV